MTLGGRISSCGLGPPAAMPDLHGTIGWCYLSEWDQVSFLVQVCHSVVEQNQYILCLQG